MFSGKPEGLFCRSLSTSRSDVGDDFVSVSLRNTLFESFRSAFDESLSLTETETSDSANSLDDSDFVSANLVESNGELSLLLSSSSRSRRASRNSDSSGNTEFLFHSFDEFRSLENCH